MPGLILWVIGFIIFMVLTARDRDKEESDDNIGMFFVDRDNGGDGDGGCDFGE